MGVLYYSTRGDKQAYTASQAILQGLAKDGGLFVPDALPKLDKTMEELSAMDYKEVAYEVMKQFLTDYTEEELKTCIKNAYNDRFDTPAIAPTVKKAGAYYLELFHGPTIAFKDMALSILPHLMVTAAKKNNCDKEIVILTATSGDTGKAAMAGFADVPGTRIVVFYPKGGVSAVQEKQMVTQKGKNVKVVGIHGNFDDAQSRVKALFGDKELEKELAEGGFQFSSANSINIGRLVPQVAYYAYAYANLLRDGELKDGELLNVVVPTGNFGNILAAFYAKQIGLPVGKLICASNENNVLTDFFKTHVYDKKREFKVTTSPSMDILVSSNLERLIFHLVGNDATKTKELMESLVATGQYQLSNFDADILDLFAAAYADEAETAAEIKRVYEASDYIEDPHTAVASAVYQKYRTQTGDTAKTVIASTASPYKFPVVAVEAVTGETGLGDFEALAKLHTLSGVPVPPAVDGLETAPVRHRTSVAAKDMQAAVEDYLGL